MFRLFSRLRGAGADVLGTAGSSEVGAATAAGLEPRRLFRVLVFLGFSAFESCSAPDDAGAVLEDGSSAAGAVASSTLYMIISGSVRKRLMDIWEK